MQKWLSIKLSIHEFLCSCSSETFVAHAIRMKQIDNAPRIIINWFLNFNWENDFYNGRSKIKQPDLRKPPTYLFAEQLLFFQFSLLYWSKFSLYLFSMRDLVLQISSMISKLFILCDIGPTWNGSPNLSVHETWLKLKLSKTPYFLLAMQ